MNVCVEPEEIPAFFMILFFINHLGTPFGYSFNRKFVASNGLSFMDKQEF